jgi:hypothetical protein
MIYTYSPVDNKIGRSCSSTLDVIWILKRNILGSETSFRVARWERFTNFVAGNHPKGVVRPRGHADLKGCVSGRYNVWRKKKLYCIIVQLIVDQFTSGCLPSVWSKRRVVLNLVGEDRSPVVPHGLPDHS